MSFRAKYRKFRKILSTNCNNIFYDSLTYCGDVFLITINIFILIIYYNDIFIVIVIICYYMLLINMFIIIIYFVIDAIGTQ